MAKEVPVSEALSRLRYALENNANQAREALITLEDLEKHLPRDETVLSLYRLSLRTIKYQLKLIAEEPKP